MDVYKTGYSQLTRCFKHIEMEQKKFVKIFLMIMVLTFAVLGTVHFWQWDFTGAQGSFQAVACMVIIAFLGKVVDILMKMLTFLKFTSMDVGRVRQSLTTGNLVQLNMRAVGKLEYIERRSMELFARTSDFWRDLEEDVVQEIWQNHSAGYAALEDRIINFIHMKHFHGARMDAELSRQFMLELMNFFSVQKWKFQGEQHDFLDVCATVQIREIFSKHHYFISEVNIPDLDMEFNQSNFAWHV